MIFQLLKYLSPTSYFNLRPKEDHQYYPSFDQLREEGIALEKDLNFVSTRSQDRDWAYRAFQIGYINKSGSQPGLDVWKDEELPLVDEYRFLRKNFHPVWVLYVLGIRLMSFYNPIKEIKAFLGSKNTKRENYALQALQQKEYEDFDSPLLKEKPLISVIIPTLNRYPYLKDVFKDLEKQDYKNFEVIVVDQTHPFQKEIYQGWKLDLKYWYQEEKALWKARNEAIKSAKGEYILLYDDDSLIEEDWISQHLKAMDFFQADLSSGVSISQLGAKVPAHYAYFRWSDQLDTGNVLIRREVFEKIGLFDRQFEKQRMGDGEFGLRAYLAGFRNISNPYAKRIHLKVGSGGLRQMGSWDGYRPKKFWGVRPIPSILYLFRKYHGDQAAVYALLKNVPPSILPYRFKGNKFLLLIGSLFSLLVSPIILIKVWQSWKQATKKLQEGAKIESLPIKEFKH